MHWFGCQIRWNNIGFWPFSLRLMVIVLWGFIVLHISYRLFVAPKKLTLNNLQVQQRILNDNLKQTKHIAQTLPELEKNVGAGQAKLQVLTQAFVSKSEANNIYNILPKMLGILQLKLLGIEPIDNKYYDVYEIHQLQLRMEGSYLKVAIFLQYLCERFPFLTIADFTLQNTQSTKLPTDSLLINFTLQEYQLLSPSET
jgi:Tfp pilus assembly protein PilO